MEFYIEHIGLDEEYCLLLHNFSKPSQFVMFVQVWRVLA
jgi:hypothetical protein